MKVKILLLLTLTLLPFCSCNGPQDRDQVEGISAEESSQLKKNTEMLSLQEGMSLEIFQKTLDLTNLENSLSQEKLLKIDIVSANASEGLGLRWGFQKEKAEIPLTEETIPENDSDNLPIVSRMTLANTTEAKAMTLPLFWPEGDLYLSNSSAIWLSDRAFEALKQKGEAEWNLGIVGDSLLGSLQEIKFFEKNLKAYNSSLQAKKEDGINLALKIKAKDKMIPFTLKINGSPKKVEARVAASDLAEYTILNNHQNPLILEVRLLPQASRAQLLVSPLTLLKPFLEYRVNAINTAH